MAYIEKDQVLLYEELCARPVKENELTERTIRFRENLKLVPHVAKNYYRSYDGVMDIDDIVQCGYEGLWRACCSYDEDRGIRFSTYAVPYIRGYILRALRDNGSLKYPRWFTDMRFSILKHGFIPPLSEEQLDILISEGRFSREQLLSYVEPEILSIDDSYIADSNRTYSEILTDTSLRLYEDYLSEEELEQAIDRLVLYAPPKYKELIEEWLYAKLEGEDINQDILASKYNISQPQCSRVLKKFLTEVGSHHADILEILGY